jgi:hypothetical protein
VKDGTHFLDKLTMKFFHLLLFCKALPYDENTNLSEEKETTYFSENYDPIERIALQVLKISSWNCAEVPPLFWFLFIHGSYRFVFVIVKPSFHTSSFHICQAHFISIANGMVLRFKIQRNIVSIQDITSERKIVWF